jgi:Zn-dependent protease with chaperone function
VIVLARIVGTFLDKAIFRKENGAGAGYWLTVIVGEIVLGLLASLIVMGFSRQREFRTDAGGARLAGTDKMIDALETFKRVHDPQGLPQHFAAFGIQRWRPVGTQAVVDEPPAAGGAHRGAALRGRFLMERGEKIILSSLRRVEARRGLRSLSDVLRCGMVHAP